MAVSRFFSPIFPHFSPKSEKCRFEPTFKIVCPARLSERKSLISSGFRRVRGLQKRPQNGHPRHSCIKDSKSGSRASGSWVRIPPYPPKESSKLKGLLDFPFSRILIFPNSCVRTAYFLVENRVQIRFCYLALYSAFHNTTRMPCNRFSTSIPPSRRTSVRRDGEIFQRTS